MSKSQGFTLIEMIIFIVVLGLVAATILLSSTTILRGAPVSHNQAIATQTATKCMEWYLAQRYVNGYNSITSPSTTVPSLCTATNGFTIATSVVNTTLAPDTASNYKTITVTVGGASSATLSLLIASY